jgi:hypothetical protein
MMIRFLELDFVENPCFKRERLVANEASMPQRNVDKTWIDCGEISYALEEPVTTLVGSPCSGVE